MMKYIKRTPLFWLLLFSGILFTLIGIAGKDTIYAQQEYDPVKAPILSVMFAAMNDDIYPWQLFDLSSIEKADTDEEAAEEKNAAEDEKTSTEKTDAESEKMPAEKTDAEGEETPAQKTDAEGEETLAEKADAVGEETLAEKADAEGEEISVEKTDVKDEEIASSEVNAKDEENAEGTAGKENQAEEGEGELQQQQPLEEIKPIRETTHEEYMAHISADIYGEAGVQRAAEYTFEPVDLTWFDDALFIGDSRTVGLRDYTDLAEHADFYCETSLTIYKVMEKEFKGKGTILEALKKKDYKKIYLMVGINELGTGTTENYLEKYTEVVEALREAQPDAVIYVQAVMRVSQKKNDQDKIFNNDNINARNHAVATLADNRHIFYIDVNEVVCDEQGALKEEYTHDQIHLLGKYNELWKEFLLGKGVELPETSMETVKQTEAD